VPWIFCAGGAGSVNKVVAAPTVSVCDMCCVLVLCPRWCPDLRAVKLHTADPEERKRLKREVRNRLLHTLCTPDYAQLPACLLLTPLFTLVAMTVLITVSVCSAWC
jgi:hypothetical protein